MHESTHLTRPGEVTLLNNRTSGEPLDADLTWGGIGLPSLATANGQANSEVVLALSRVQVVDKHQFRGVAVLVDGPTRCARVVAVGKEVNDLALVTRAHCLSHEECGVL